MVDTEMAAVAEEEVKEEEEVGGAAGGGGGSGQGDFFDLKKKKNYHLGAAAARYPMLSERQQMKAAMEASAREESKLSALAKAAKEIRGGDEGVAGEKKPAPNQVKKRAVDGGG